MCHFDSNFNSLVEREWAALVGLLIARGVPPADAPDLIQEALLRMFAAGAKDEHLAERLCTDPAAFRAYILTTAWNLRIDRVRLKESRLTRTFSELERDGESDQGEPATFSDGQPSVLEALIDTEQARLAEPMLHKLDGELSQYPSQPIRRFVCLFQEVEGHPKDSPSRRLLRLCAYLYHLTDDRPEISNRILGRQLGPAAGKKEWEKQRDANDGICRQLKQFLDRRFTDEFGRAPESGRKPYGEGRENNRRRRNLSPAMTPVC